MSEEMAPSRFAIIVGVGPAGIAMACKLKKHGINNFLMIDRNAAAGGTWFANSYPGCACDVPSLLYSFSFAPKRDWTRPMAEREEILSYFDSVMTHFDIHSHARYQTECTRATWSEKACTWRIELSDLLTGQQFTEEASLFVAATGLFSRPQYPDINGLKEFKGELWHSAEWGSHRDVKGKRVAVIGSGPSAMQLIPRIAREARQLCHFSRQKRWIFKENNKTYNTAQRCCLQRVPFLHRALRLREFLRFELDYFEHLDGFLPERIRSYHQKISNAYIHNHGPHEYRDSLIPTYPYGCKRRVVDTGYLDCINAGAELVTSAISHVDESGISTTDGHHREFDSIILATGFSTQDYLSPIEVHGIDENTSMKEYWDQAGGPRAYNSVSVSGFPNMAILFGPNGAPSHHSAIFNIESEVNYAFNTYVRALLGGFRSVDVQRQAEERQADALQYKFRNTRHAATCASSLGADPSKNCVSFPGLSMSFWKQLKGSGMRDYILK